MKLMKKVNQILFILNEKELKSLESIQEKSKEENAIKWIWLIFTISIPLISYSVLIYIKQPRNISNFLLEFTNGSLPLLYLGFILYGMSCCLIDLIGSKVLINKKINQFKMKIFIISILIMILNLIFYILESYQYQQKSIEIASANHIFFIIVNILLLLYSWSISKILFFSQKNVFEENYADNLSKERNSHGKKWGT